jgi:hypothetical protein
MFQSTEKKTPTKQRFITNDNHMLTLGLKVEIEKSYIIEEMRENNM